MRVPDKVEQFSSLIKEITTDSSTSAASIWNQMREKIYDCALKSFGRKRNSKQDWFEDNTSVLLPLIEVKRKALLDYQQNPSPENLQKLSTARKNFWSCSRKCANEYWLSLSTNIQNAAAKGDTKSVFDGIRKGTGPSKRLTAPLKSSTD